MVVLYHVKNLRKEFAIILHEKCKNVPQKSMFAVVKEKQKV